MLSLEQTWTMNSELRQNLVDYIKLSVNKFLIHLFFMGLIYIYNHLMNVLNQCSSWGSY